MSRKVYLHVGAPKTGTTYLQDRLALNAATLADHGVHFPSRHALADPALSQFRAAIDLMGQDWGGPPGHAKGAWPALVRRIGRLEGTVVVSHEVLAPAAAEHVQRAMADLTALGGTEVHVVYSVRDPARQVPAAWQEAIKQGGLSTYRRYTRLMTRGNIFFARAFDLPRVLETWGSGLPRDRVHVVTVPQARGDELWLRSCAALGIDPAWAPRDSEAVNRSMGVAETTVLRRLNRRLEDASRKDASYDRVVRETLVQGMLANRRGTRVQLPPDMHPWAVAEAERWTAWLRESGVHVVGDLDDLLPRPTDAASYVDPERVSPKAQLGAALDALAVMTGEAARRDDPDARLRVRLRERVTDRLHDRLRR
ncbi:hypothetical protein [Nocardioides litoris]|uniref:hypothetical protein n=1 Tax=Nocardioides litoris TaxID=1926648 RepID=UPI00111DF201|nr:hypothetical protein [Nocardioides litoris]